MLVWMIRKSSICWHIDMPLVDIDSIYAFVALAGGAFLDNWEACKWELPSLI